MNKLLLIDGHSILNRAYYGLPDLTNSKGQHTNGVYGFLNMMLRFIDTEKPTHFAVAFDVHEPTFRHRMFDAYKGTRKPMDPELREQVPYIQDMLRAMKVPVITKAGFEADDILGTLSKSAEEQGFDVTIISGDRDLLQLASDHIKISIPKTKKTGTEIEEYFAADVLEQKGVTPIEFIDVKALMGDTADNIPGVPGIGEKTATSIIKTYHTVEEAYLHVDELKPPKASKNLKEFYDQAMLSKDLARIEIHADIEFSLDEALLGNLFTEEAYRLCKSFEFKNLLPRFEGVEHTSSNQELEDKFHLVEEVERLHDYVENLTNEAGFTIYMINQEEKGFDPDEDGQLQLSFTEEEEPYRILGLSISSGEDAIYVPASDHISGQMLVDTIQDLIDRGLPLATRDLKAVLPKLNIPMVKLADPHLRKDGYTYPSVFDCSVASYLLNPLLGQYETSYLASEELEMMVPSFSDFFGKASLLDATEDKDKFSKYACFDAYVAAKSAPILRTKLQENDMLPLYVEVELPLIHTLSDMEQAGMAMDGKALLEYGRTLSERISELENEIYEAAGEEFNINSPKQLGVILFEKLELPGAKKTKTGYSTSADVLDKLSADYPIVDSILQYRQLTKLKSTYADGLNQCLSKDGRVHSTFQQTVTATGRISSTDPNLQNIPIRMELGKQIRKVFFSEEGATFLDADYSQIELRVLAHLSQDENLIEAYRRGQDIHRATASLVFHVPFEEVTELQRRNAKAVNFGIVYGISSFGLSQDLNISKAEAKEYIDNYFLAYPKLQEYIEGLVEDAKQSGVAKTLFGRIRPIPELSSSNFMQRSFGERVAMNAPIQGTAADIIKIAMVGLHDRMKAEGLESRLVLQVHDELLVEAKDSELETVQRLMEEEMMGAAKLLVPLEIDMHAGHTWYDAK